jgi:DNA ligase-1
MTATAQINPILLRDWQGADVSGWLMSEKLDGWRLLWDGERFLSRQGRELNAPEWFKAGMPGVPLDGELFAGRGNFNFIRGMMRDGWHGLTFQVFDAPTAIGGYASRYDALQSIALPPHAAVVAQCACESTQHLRAYSDEITMCGGEGAVVRDPDAQYIVGRTATIQRHVPQPPEWNRNASA